MTFVLPLLFSSFGQMPDPGKLAWERRNTGIFEVELNWSVKYPGFAGKEWIVVAPIFPELPGHKVQNQGMFPGKTTLLDEEGPLHRKYLRTSLVVGEADIPDFVTKEKMEVKLRAKIFLQSRKLVVPKGMARGRGGQTIELKAEEKKAYLRSSTTLDWESKEFRNWQKEQSLLREPGELDWSLAKRYFLFVRNKIKFRDDPKADKKVSSAAPRGEGDLSSLNAVFVALCRSQGIPSRIRIGRMARSSVFAPNRAGGGRMNHQWYMRSEWYHFQLGWVPVDLFWNASQSSTEAQHLQWFGNDPGDMVVFHEDLDFKINSGAFGNKEFPGLDSLPVWVIGMGKLDAQTIAEEWKVKKVPK